jgi:hypothetical protein
LSDRADGFLSAACDMIFDPRMPGKDGRQYS